MIHAELKEWVSKQDRKIGLASLSIEVKGRRERAKLRDQKSQQQESLATPPIPDEENPTKKRRAAPIDPRPRPKKRKFEPR